MFDFVICLDIYARLTGESAEFDSLLVRIHEKVSQELEVCENCCDLKSCLDMIIA